MLADPIVRAAFVEQLRARLPDPNPCWGSQAFYCKAVAVAPQQQDIHLTKPKGGEIFDPPNLKVGTRNTFLRAVALARVACQEHAVSVYRNFRALVKDGKREAPEARFGKGQWEFWTPHLRVLRAVKGAHAVRDVAGELRSAAERDPMFAGFPNGGCLELETR